MDLPILLSVSDIIYRFRNQYNNATNTQKVLFNYVRFIHALIVLTII